MFQNIVPEQHMSKEGLSPLLRRRCLSKHRPLHQLVCLCGRLLTGVPIGNVMCQGSLVVLDAASFH